MRRFAGLAAVVIAAMALGQLITDKIPLSQGAVAPFVHEAKLGEKVKLRYADVTVKGIRSGKYIDGADFAVAGGTFLIVDLELIGKGEPHLMSGLYVFDSKNRRYEPTTRGSSCPQNTTPPTGLRWNVMVCFDLSRQALEGAKLNVSQGGYEVNGSGQRRDDMAMIDLDIDKQKAAELWESKLAYESEYAGFLPLDKTPIPAPTAEAP